MKKLRAKWEAAIKLQPLYNIYEERKCSVSTLYKKIWFDGKSYRCSGKAHDYTLLLLWHVSL